MYNPLIKPCINDLERELVFKSARSGGPGGQHVNKVESKVILYFNVSESQILTQEQKDHLAIRLINRLDQNGNLRISVTTSRSQLKNKKEAILRFSDLMNESFTLKKKRKKTKIPWKAVQNRMNKKKLTAEKKLNRKKDYNLTNRNKRKQTL